MDANEIRKEIEEAYKNAGEKCNEFAKAVAELRQINMNVDKDNSDEIKQAMELGRDIDMRTAYLLRILLIQFGNTLFI